MKTVDTIDWGELVNGLDGRPLAEAVQTITKAAIDKMNEMVNEFNTVEELYTMKPKKQKKGKVMIIPLADRVLLVKEVAKTQTSSGILLTTDSIERQAVAFVVGIGKGVKDSSIKVGDKVIYKEYSVTDIKVDEKELMLIKEEDIIAIVEDKNI